MFLKTKNGCYYAESHTFAATDQYRCRRAANGRPYNAISGMDISAKEANQLLQSYDGSVTAEAYASGISEAYNYGRMGVAYKGIDFRGYAAAIPEQVRKNAYQMALCKQ